MAPKFSSTISDLLTGVDNGGLRYVLQKAQALRALEAVLAHHLDPVLLEHCRVSTFQLGELLLYVDSPAWATHIRYLTPDLLQLLANEPLFKGLRRIHCKVLPPTATAAKTPSPVIPKQLPEDTQALIKTTAEGITNLKLRDALLRLVKKA